MSAALFFLATLAGIFLGRRNAGLLSWGSLAPAYFLFMLLVAPLVNYLDGSYRNYIVIPTEEDIVRLYVLSSIAIICFSSLYFLTGQSASFGFIRRLSSRYSSFVYDVFSDRVLVLSFIVASSIAGMWSMAFGYFGLTNRDSSEVGSFAGVIAIVSYLTNFVNIILWVRFFQIGQRKKDAILPWMTLTLLLLFAVFGNSKAALIFPFIQVMLAYVFVNRRFPVLPALILVVFFLVLIYPVIQGFRYSVYFGLEDKSPLSYISMFVDYLFGFSWLDSTSTPEGEKSLALGRGLFSYLAYIFRVAGDSVPFLNGRTYLEGFEVFVPRVMLPDKVDMSTGHWTGQLFDHVGLEDPITNVSPTYMGEFYMNNGVLGLFMGMGMLGVFARLIDEWIFKASGAWLKVVFVINILWLEAFVGTTILVFIKTFLIFVVCVYMLSFFSRRVTKK